MSIAIAETRWFELGAYRVLACPLRLNPYWTSYRVFRDGKFVGSQISMPTIGDAQWLERTSGLYAREDESHKHSGGWIVRAKKR